MSWQRPLGDGLSWYTALGHEIGMYAHPAYRQHLLGGLLTVPQARWPASAAARVRAG